MTEVGVQVQRLAASFVSISDGIHRGGDAGLLASTARDKEPLIVGP